MRPYEFRLNDIVYSPETMDAFADALRAHDDAYTGLFTVLDDTSRYVKLLVEYHTSWCVAQLWTYGKDGQPFPATLDLSGAELRAIVRDGEWMASEA